MMEINNSNAEKVTVLCAEDCGNAPKKALLKAFNTAFVQNDESMLIEKISDDIYWNIVGNQRIQGKDQFFETHKQMNRGTVSELHIHNIITHGRVGSVNGYLIFKDQKSLAFCDVYQFTSAGKKAKIKEITSYVIETS